MATPIIQSVGASSGAGTPGEGRNDLVAGELVTLSDSEPANAGASYVWQFEDVPIGTTPTLANDTTPTPTFVTDANPAVAGSYRMRATVNGLESAVVVLAVPLTVTGGRIPSYQEQREYNQGGNAKGWHESQTQWMRSVESRLADAGPGKAGDKLIQLIWGGGRNSHNSATPLVVGGFALNPNDYTLANATMVLRFSIVAANGNTPLTTHAEIFNLTDNEVVTTSILSVVNSTAPTHYVATLTVGAAANTIKNSGEKVYECRIWVDAPANPDTDSIELFKAEVAVVFTVIAET